MRFVIGVAITIAIALNIFMWYTIVFTVGVSGLIVFVLLGLLVNGLLLQASKSAFEDW